MKTDTQLRIERARALGIYYEKDESNSQISCGCGYKGKAPKIAYSEYDEDMMDEVICPGCGDS